MKDKKTEKDLSILDAQDTEKDTIEEEVVEAVEEIVESAEGETLEEVKEKKKIKPWVLITSVVLIIAILAVGAWTWYTVSTLATYDGGRITRGEYNDMLEKTMMAQGITEETLNDPDNADAINQFKNELLVSLAYDEIFYKQLNDLGVGQLTEEEIAAIEEDCRTMLDDYVAANDDTILMGLAEGYTERDYKVAVAKFETDALNQIGCRDFNDFVDLRVDEDVFYKAYEELLPDEDVAPTDEEVKAEYDILLESQIATYDDDTSGFLYDRASIEMLLYVPDGIRNVRHILIQIDEETMTEIQTLKSEGKEDEADKLFEQALEAIKPEAEEVLAKLDAGEITFTDAIFEYGDDPGMEYYPEGYEVCEGYGSYVEEFTTGAMSLENVGDYTGLVSTDYGYHIIEFFSETPSEVTPYDEVATELYLGLLEANRSNKWMDLLNQWPKDLNLAFKDQAVQDLYELGIYN